MKSKLRLLRVLGERIGHLSRHAQTGQLCRELGDVSSALTSGAAIAAFRRAFFGAGGTQEHWAAYVADAISGAAPPPMEPTRDAAPDTLEWDQLWRELVGRDVVIDDTVLGAGPEGGA